MSTANSKIFRKHLGKKVRAIRTEQKISQSQLAFESGLSREQIYRMELGYMNITIDTLIAISSALDVPPKELFDF